MVYSREVRPSTVPCRVFSPFVFGYLSYLSTLYLSTLYGLSTLFNSSSNHYLSTTLRLSFVPSPSFIAAAMPVSLCFSRCPSFSSQRQSNHDSLTLLPRQAGLSPAFPPNPWFTFQPNPLGLSPGVSPHFRSSAREFNPSFPPDGRTFAGRLCVRGASV